MNDDNELTYHLILISESSEEIRKKDKIKKKRIKKNRKRIMRKLRFKK